MKKALPDCDNPSITNYQFIKNGDANGDFSQKSVTCDDGPCSCERWICECNNIFAKANTLAYNADKYRFIITMNGKN